MKGEHQASDFPNQGQPKSHLVGITQKVLGQKSQVLVSMGQ